MRHFLIVWGPTNTLETLLEVLATLPTKSSSAQQAQLRQQKRHVFISIVVVTLRVSKLMLHIKHDLDTHEVVQRTGDMHIEPV